MAIRIQQVNNSDLARFVELLGVLVVQAVIEVIVLRPGDQLAQRNGAIASKSKLLDEADFLSWRGGSRQPRRKCAPSHTPPAAAEAASS